MKTLVMRSILGVVTAVLLGLSGVSRGQDAAVPRILEKLEESYRRTASVLRSLNNMASKF